MRASYLSGGEFGGEREPTSVYLRLRHANTLVFKTIGSGRRKGYTAGSAPCQKRPLRKIHAWEESNQECRRAEGWVS